MIKIYYKGSCNSSKRAMKWLISHGIPFERHLISRLPREELLRLLPLTSEGMTTLVKGTAKASPETRNELLKLKNMKFNDGINFLNVHPDLLQTPLIIDGDKFMVGFNSEEIRQFLPKAYRKIRKEYTGTI